MKQPGYYARLILWILLGVLIGYLIGKHIVVVNAKNIDKVAVPVPSVTPRGIEPTATPTLTPKQKTIEAEIREVFGVHADKALMLLRGNGPGTCHENGNLDPTITNKNTDALKTIDYGVFQINSHWQGVSNTKFLLDPGINIRIAYRIFVDDGYSFKQWSCGRALNI